MNIVQTYINDLIGQSGGLYTQCRVTERRYDLPSGLNQITIIPGTPVAIATEFTSTTENEPLSGFNCILDANGGIKSYNRGTCRTSQKTEGGILWWTYYNEDCVFFKGNAIFKSTVNTVHATSIRIISLTPY